MSTPEETLRGIAKIRFQVYFGLMAASIIISSALEMYTIMIIPIISFVASEILYRIGMYDLQTRGDKK